MAHKTNIIITKLTLRDCSSEGLLLHGREMVLGGTSDGHTEASEAKTVSDQRSPHSSFLAFIYNKCICFYKLLNC